MDKIDNELIEKLYLENTAYDFVMEFLDAVCFPNKASDSLEEQRRSVTRQLYKENLDVVFQVAKSRTEKMFLNALLLQNILFGSYFIKYTGPIQPVEKTINDIRNNYFYIMNLWQGFQDVNGSDEEGTKFLDYIFNSPDLSSEDKDLIFFNMFYMHALKHINVFHISLHCYFDEVTVAEQPICPDLLIWVPSRPEFKLVVECDEFQYHSDRKAFTNDRERDRFLRDNDFQVLRFSDHEIEIDAASRARELLIYLRQLNKEMFREEIAEDYQSKQQVLT